MNKSLLRGQTGMFALLVLLTTFTLLQGQQLQEMQYEEIPGGNIILDRADRSLLIVESAIPKLMFESTRGIKPGSVKEEKPGVWYVYLEPGVQLISISAEGYLPVRDVRHNFQPRQAWQLKVTGDQPKGVGSIRIETNPSGASIILNNIPVPGTTPLTLQDQPTGTHSIRIDKDSYGSLEETVTIEKDKTVTRTFTLQKEYAGLKVTSDPSGATVFLDGNQLGITPLERNDLSQGECNMIIVMDGYESNKQLIRLVYGQTKSYHADLVQQEGSVRLTTEPTGAEVFLDGKSYGIFDGEPIIINNLGIGEHIAEATLEYHDKDTEKFKVLYKKTNRVELKLIPQPGSLFVSTTPMGASIILDGVNSNKKSPAKIDSIIIGEHALILVLEGYRGLLKHIIIQPGRTVSIDEKLIDKYELSPEIVLRICDNALKSWLEKFKWENPEKSADLRMIYQEEILKNIITPVAPVDSHDRQIVDNLQDDPNYAAKSLSRLLALEHEEYDKLCFKLPKSKLTADKTRKREWRNSLIERYNELISLARKEGWQAFYAKGRLFNEEALATYEQEIPYIPKQDSAMSYLDAVVDDAILLNYGAILQFEEGYTRLDAIGRQLVVERKKFQKDVDRLKKQLDQMQLDIAAVGIDDSTKKLDVWKKALIELDASISEVKKWKIACREPIPEIVVRNGDYALRSWLVKFNWENPKKAADIRMIYQEEILKNIITPGAPEVCGLYLQAIETIKETNIYTDYWIQELEKRFTHVVDTLLIQWDRQFMVSKEKIDGYIQEYSEMLPEGEFAESKEGLLLDMMGEQILMWTDYLNVHNLDKLKALTAILDTVVQYKRPVGFGDESLGRPLQGVLEYFDVLNEYSAVAEVKKVEYAKEYEENPYYYDEYYEEDIERYWYNDAASAYDEIALTFNDYSVGLLEEGLRITDKYSLSCLAGISIKLKLVELKPDVYVERVGIEPQNFTLVSSTDWLIWPEYMTGFEQIDFDDSDWEHPHVAYLPGGSNLGILSYLGATPIWFNLDDPPALPEWVEYPKDVIGFEGELIEFTLLGVVPVRKMPFLDEYEDEGYDEFEEEYPDWLPEFTKEEKKAAAPPVGLRIEYRSTDIPENEVAFVDKGDGSAVFYWTPSYAAAGVYSAMFTLYNYGIPVPIIIPIIVRNVDH